MAYSTGTQSSNPVPRGTVVSLNIPWTELDQSEDFIGRTVGALGWGWVSCVQLVRKEGKRPHNMAYVHFSHWASTEDARKALAALESCLELKVFYRGNWFWKIRKSRFEYREPVAPVAPSAPTWSVSAPGPETLPPGPSVPALPPVVSLETEASNALEEADIHFEAEISELEADMTVASTDDTVVSSYGYLESPTYMPEASDLGKTMMSDALKATADRVLLGGSGKRLRVKFTENA